MYSPIKVYAIPELLPIQFIRPKLGIIQEGYLSKPEIAYDLSIQRMMLEVEWTDEEGCDVSKWVPLMNVVQHSEQRHFVDLEHRCSDMLLFPTGWCKLSRSMFIRRLQMEFSLIREMESFMI